jgi:hypothetical protein
VARKMGKGESDHKDRMMKSMWKEGCSMKKWRIVKVDAATIEAEKLKVMMKEKKWKKK